nr:MAG TPA: hypothetical protein [Caudoviricetes sp.]
MRFPSFILFYFNLYALDFTRLEKCRKAQNQKIPHTMLFTTLPTILKCSWVSFRSIS